MMINHTLITLAVLLLILIVFLFVLSALNWRAMKRMELEAIRLRSKHWHAYGYFHGGNGPSGDFLIGFMTEEKAREKMAALKLRIVQVDPVAGFIFYKETLQPSGE